MSRFKCTKADSERIVTLFASIIIMCHICACKHRAVGLKCINMTVVLTSLTTEDIDRGCSLMIAIERAYEHERSTYVRVNLE